jgi:hypothetical protein
LDSIFHIWSGTLLSNSVNAALSLFHQRVCVTIIEITHMQIVWLLLLLFGTCVAVGEWDHVDSYLWHAATDTLADEGVDSVRDTMVLLHARQHPPKHECSRRRLLVLHAKTMR